MTEIGWMFVPVGLPYAFLLPLPTIRTLPTPYGWADHGNTLWLQEVATPHNLKIPCVLIAFNHPLLPPTHGTESLESELEFSYHIGVKHTTFESL